MKANNCLFLVFLFKLQISFSTVGNMLGLIIKRVRSTASSASGNKRKKLTDQQEAELHCYDIFGRENSVYILSSFLDVLLLKKDMTNRLLLTLDNYILNTD